MENQFWELYVKHYHWRYLNFNLQRKFFSFYFRKVLIKYPTEIQAQVVNVCPKNMSPSPLQGTIVALTFFNFSKKIMFFVHYDFQIDLHNDDINYINWLLFFFFLFHSLSLSSMSPVCTSIWWCTNDGTNRSFWTIRLLYPKLEKIWKSLLSAGGKNNF